MGTSSTIQASGWFSDQPFRLQKRFQRKFVMIKNIMTRSPICTAGIFMRNGKVLLGLRNHKTQQYKDGDFWTTPGGRCDEGESVEVTLRREVGEEIGVKNFEIKKGLGVVPGAKEGDSVHVFLCETDEEAKLMEPEKFKEWKWFLPNEIPENFLNRDVLKIIKKL